MKDCPVVLSVLAGDDHGLVAVPHRHPIGMGVDTGQVAGAQFPRKLAVARDREGPDGRSCRGRSLNRRVHRVDELRGDGPDHPKGMVLEAPTALQLLDLGPAGVDLDDFPQGLFPVGTSEQYLLTNLERVEFHVFLPFE